MIKLYHGTNILFDVPDLTKCNPSKDFGRGFYLTPDLAAAKRMANRTPRLRAADHNRDNRYDLVVGPVADDKMVGLFKMFERGIWPIERIVEELRYKKLTMQYSFHTAKGLSKLVFKEAKRV